MVAWLELSTTNRAKSSDLAIKRHCLAEKSVWDKKDRVGTKKRSDLSRSIYSK